MNWQPWIAPAVLLSVVAFLSRFFGKIIADQRAFADDRDWDVELSGIMFLTKLLISPGIVAVAILIYFKATIFANLTTISLFLSPLDYHSLDLIIVFAVNIYYGAGIMILSRERYNFPKLLPNITEEQHKKRVPAIINFNAVLLEPLAALIIFIFGIEIMTGSILWIAAFSIEIFLSLIFFALGSSLMQYSFPKVNIVFTGRKAPLRNVMLLKMNKDNIKVRNGDDVSIIERKEVLRVDVPVNGPTIFDTRPIIPFTAWIPILLALFLIWDHRLILAIIVGIVLPMFLQLVATWLLGISPEQIGIAKISISNPKQRPSTPAIILFIAFSLALIVSIISAWTHHGTIFFYFGVVPLMIIWMVLGIYFPLLSKGSGKTENKQASEAGAA